MRGRKGWGELWEEWRLKRKKLPNGLSLYDYGKYFDALKRAGRSGW